MDNPTAGEAKLLAKYWGKDGFELDDQFWADVLSWMKEVNVLLPLEHNMQNVRMVREMLDCKPGTCGDCCRYGILPITKSDIQRIVTRTDFTIDYLKTIVWHKENGTMFIKAGNDCPFLKDNACIIYNGRPDACYFYPVQLGGHVATANGRSIFQMRYRVKCKESVSVIRQILTSVLKEGDKMLLPNLLIIPKEV